MSIGADYWAAIDQKANDATAARGSVWLRPRVRQGSSRAYHFALRKTCMILWQSWTASIANLNCEHFYKISLLEMAYIV